jgi:hypothetical protein
VAYKKETEGVLVTVFVLIRLSSRPWQREVMRSVIPPSVKTPTVSMARHRTLLSGDDWARTYCIRTQQELLRLAEPPKKIARMHKIDREGPGKKLPEEKKFFY